MRRIAGPILGVLGLATLLSSCASAIGSLPGIGLPAGTPAAPAKPYPFPAVFDAPPSRPVPMLSEEQQIQVERRLTAARKRQEAHQPAGKKAARVVKTAKKKKPSRSARTIENPGAGTNP